MVPLPSQFHLAHVRGSGLQDLHSHQLIGYAFSSSSNGSCCSVVADRALCFRLSLSPGGALANMVPGSIMMVRDHIRWFNSDPLIDVVEDPR